MIRLQCLALLSLSLILSSLTAHARPMPALVLADTRLLMDAGIRILDSEPETGVSLAEVSEFQEWTLSRLAHDYKKCGGYQRIPVQPWMSSMEARELGRQALLQLQYHSRRLEQNFGPGLPKPIANPLIEAALREVSEDQLRDTVTWLSGFSTRFHKSPTPNQHVEEFKKRLEKLVAVAPWKATVDLIAHQNTPQKSVRVRLEGKTLPEEIVVLGAHLDSINQSWGESRAPGADDNASGSSNILEALRILTHQPQPERTIELFWYAGEEGGLIGSSEIAQSYAKAHKNVIGVLQLDMTLFPGDGELVLGSMTDFTSPTLRKWLVGLNQAYLGAKIVDDKCGYACSDHASWHSNGYPAIMPFEATFDRMFPDLHTTRDLIGPRSSFQHSALFAKLAVAFAMELAGY